MTLVNEVDPDTMATETQSFRGGRVRHVYREAMRGFAVEMPEVAARALARDSRVASVEEDGVTRASGVNVQAFPPSWGLDRIDQRSPEPLDNAYGYSADGTGVHVYVMDTGIRTTHVDFGGRAFGAFSAIADGVAPGVDCHGHGTHVAGVIGGAVSGVAKNVTLHSVRALQCDGFGAWSEYIAAIDWIIANHLKPAVINASIGGYVEQAANDAVNRAIAAGITFVAAAGNSNSDACVFTPGPVSAVLLVASATREGVRSPDSNWGRCVDVFAPGSAIVSASGSDDGRYDSMWGTSMAAPHVAGAAALYLQRSAGATPAAVARAILSGATSGVVSDAGPGTPNRHLFTPYLGDSVSPVVVVTTPASNAIVGGTLTVAAAASDDVELRDVTFIAGSTVLGRDAWPPYTAVWHTAMWSNGTYALRADARDRAGNLTRSVAVVVTVRNAEAPTPTLWSTSAVGPGDAGYAVYSNGVYTVAGEGSDVWGTSDAFQFARRRWTGDGDLVARVSQLAPPTGAKFAMAGLTFRESIAPDARHASLVITTEGKVKLRRRTVVGGTTLSNGPSAGTTYPPRWLKLSRRGNVFTGYVSVDGKTWTRVYAESVTLPTTVDVGFLALRNGGAGTARATFRDVRLSSSIIDMANRDVGDTGQLGAVVQDRSGFTVEGGGSDLWSTADAFHFVYRSWTGDGTFITKLEALSKPAGSSFALGALMIRETLAADARHASIMITTDGKAKFRRRTSPGGTTLSDGPSAGSVTVPRWLKLTRTGTVVSASISADGVTWEAVSRAQSIAIPATIYVGLATLRNGGSALSVAKFSDVTFD